MFSLIVPLEVGGYFGLLLEFLIKLLEAIHEEDAVVVLIFDESPLGYLEVQLVKTGLSDEFPEPTVGVFLDELYGILEGDSGEEVARVSQGFRLILDNHLGDALDFFRVLQDVVKKDCLDLEIGEVAQVSGTEDRLLWLEIAKDIETVFLHKGAKLGVVAGPNDGPDFLALGDQMLALHLRVGSSNIACSAGGFEVVEAEDTIDINDGELGRIAIHAKLLGSASQHDLVLQLDVGQGVLVNLPTHSADDKSIRAGCDRANKVCARDLRFLPLISVIDLIGVRNFLNMEGVFLARLFLLLLLKSRELGVLRAILPVVHNVIACNDYVSFVHGDKLGLNRDVLVFNWASDSIAENYDILAGIFFGFCDKHTVLPASDYLLKSSHVFHVLLIDDCVPEDHAHVLALGLFESENESIVEVGPQILWLDVGEEDV